MTLDERLTLVGVLHALRVRGYTDVTLYRETSPGMPYGHGVHTGMIFYERARYKAPGTNHPHMIEGRGNSALAAAQALQRKAKALPRVQVLGESPSCEPSSSTVAPRGEPAGEAQQRRSAAEGEAMIEEPSTPEQPRHRRIWWEAHLGLHARLQAKVTMGMIDSKEAEYRLGYHYGVLAAVYKAKPPATTAFVPGPLDGVGMAEPQDE